MFVINKKKKELLILLFRYKLSKLYKLSFRDQNNQK